MKQGIGTTVTSMKVEPRSHSVCVEAVSDLGQVETEPPDALYDGRGFSAPRPVGETIHHCGSQGKHS